MVATLELVGLIVIGLLIMGIAIFIKRFTLSDRISLFSLFIMIAGVFIVLAIPFINNILDKVLFIFLGLIGIILLILAIFIYNIARSNTITSLAIGLIIIGISMILYSGFKIFF